MNDNNSIVKNGSLSVVSFETKNRCTPQIKIVVDLIKRCVEECRPLTRHDMIDAYIEWRTKHKSCNKFYKKRWQVSNGDTWHGRYLYTEISADEYKRSVEAIDLSRIWFKNNLASAVIKGRLLVLPVIDIDSGDCLPNIDKIDERAVATKAP